MAEYADLTVSAAQRLVGDVGDRSVAPVYMDGIEIDVLREAVATADFRAGQRQNQATRFWATPARYQEDFPVRDVIEIDLSTSRLVNDIRFDLAHFPHRAEVEYSATNDGEWLPVIDGNGIPIVIETVDSNPPILSSNANQSLAHPHHFGAGHWMHQAFKTIPVQASRFRVVLTRAHGGVPPTDSQGNAMPYSLGVRGFVVGYQIETRDDIPDRPLVPGSYTTHQPIETTRDLLGSTVSYAERENPAVNLLENGVWRSEPQPVPYAVVNLYADVRTEDDAPQVIERFFLDPITSGCAVNIYYTQQIPDLDQQDPWDYVVWTPVARDFAARRGFLRFDPTLATFFKFEFTDLAPEPYDATQALVRHVRLFPGGLESLDPISRSGNDGGSGTVVNGALEGILRFDDNERLVAQNLTDLSRGFSPTEVFYSKDPAAAARLRDLSENYNFLPWQGGTQTPHWPGTQTHPYARVEVLHDQRVAFYVAIANLVAYRLDYSFDEDTDQYLEYFFDDESLASSQGWTLSPQDARTGTAEGVVARMTSKVLPSRTDVRGIQFATTQSPPMQLLPDDDFNSGVVDPDVVDENGVQVARWIAFGENGEATPLFEVSNEFNTDIGTTVRIRREEAQEVEPHPLDTHLWRHISNNYRTWKGITDRGLTYADLARQRTDAEKNRLAGIKSTTYVTPAPGARVYLAARVISKIDQIEPLYVQIFDEISGEVVAEAAAQVPANKVVEWYVDYDASASANVTIRTWDEVEQAGPTYATLQGQTFYEVSHTEGPVAPVRLQGRLVQKGAANASWFADTVSLFEESILWEFSNDAGATWWAAPGIRNNPHGVLVFPEASETSYLNTYESIEKKDPSPTAPTWGSLAASRYADLEVERRGTKPDRSKLMWRVSCGRPNQHINALSIRPWYVGTERGVLSTEGVDVAGPNKAMYDHYQPIGLDPRYRLWHKPIPQAWYFFYRQFTLLRHDDYVPTPLTLNTILSDALIVKRVPYTGSADVIGDGLVIPVGGPLPPEVEPLTTVMPDAFILRST